MTALLERPPHPAARRRTAALLPPPTPHEVRLRPLGGGGEKAMIVTAREPAFLEAIFADLRAPDWAARLDKRRGVRATAGVLDLGLPIHRHFQIVLLEAVCRAPGYPRVDPHALESMGLVLRRIEKDRLSGWMKDDAQPRGWLGVAPGRLAIDDPDPDPARRGAGGAPVAGQLAAMLAKRRGGAKPSAEEVAPLFVAPPEVCAALGKTVVYGIVPVASSDRAGTAAVPDFNDLLPDDAAAVLKHLSVYFKGRRSTALPHAGETLDPAWHVLQAPVAPDPDSAADPEANAQADAALLHGLGLFLQQLKVELAAFGGGAAAAALLAELNTITLVMARDAHGRTTATRPAGAWLRDAADILIAGTPNRRHLRMPLEWPLYAAGQGTRLVRLAQTCLGAQFRLLVAETPKFDRDEALYTVRPFVRVAGHAQCAPKLVWADCYSEPFHILPWWDSDAPAARVSLPALNRLKALKPNVTFELPPALANLLQGDMKKLKDGDGGPPSELGIGWLCSFSIPIITICAFIVLNIFLTLFDIIFFWMAYLKICIPYPKAKS